MNTVIIGPLPPHRGGISHSNSILASNLSKRHRVTAVTFRRMFPQFLYPGKDQTDPDSHPPKNIRILPVLDSINPLSWIRSYRIVRNAQAERLIFQWWSPFFVPCYLTIALLVKLFTKTKISVICQNVVSHENRRIERILTKMFFRAADFFVTYSSSDKREVKKLLPGARVVYIIEGTYVGQLGKREEKAAAKRKLGMKGKNILFFGFVRDYKGLSTLLRALPAVVKKCDVTLHIVGEFWEDKNKYVSIIRDHGMEKKVKIVDRYVSDREAVRYFSAADVVVLPYISSTESGIVQLAYGLNTPIITTAVGGNVDLITHGKTGLLVPPKNVDDLAEAIILFYSKNLEKYIRKNMSTSKHMFSWTKEKERRFFGIG